MPVAEAKRRKTVRTTRPIRVLIIEHSKPDAELCLRELERAGYAVEADVVDNLGVCAEKIRNVPYDIILSDYKLEGWTGMDAFLELGRCGKDTPFILVTGTIGEETAVDCIKLGVTDYVLKDRMARLSVAVRRALEAKSLEDKQHRTAKQLWATEAQLGLVFAQLPAIVWTTDHDLRIQTLNGMGLPRLGWKEDQVIGCTLQKIYATDDRDHPAIAAHRRALLGQSAHYELTHGDREFYVAVEPLRGQKGEVGGCLSLALDVTETKLAQEEIRARVAQQSTVAALGLRALHGTELSALKDDTVQSVAETLGVDYCNLLELLPDGRALLLRAGVNLEEGRAGHETVATGKGSQAGYTLETDKPVIVDDWSKETRFAGPLILKDQAITSGLSVVIPGRERPFGVLTAHSKRERKFTGHDASFLQSVANVFATAIERKQADQKLQESNQMLEMLIESSPVPIVAMDRFGSVFHWNTSAETTFGWKKEEIIGKRYPLAPLDKQHEFQALLDVVLQGGTFAGVEVHRIRKDGSPVEVSLSAAPLRNAAGEVIGALSVIADITERKRAEAERQRLSTAVEQSAQSVVITDHTGKIQYVNPAFTAVTGYSREEAMGKTTQLLKSGRQDPEFYACLWQTIKAGETWRGEIINRRKDGAFYTAEMSITPVRDESGKIVEFIAIHNDITQKRALERQLAQAQKHDAIGQLAGGIAHDFNNVLGAVLGMAELGLMEVSQGSKIHERLKKIQHHAGRAVALTRQLTAFARRQELERRDINLNHAVAEVISLLGETLGKDIELRTKLAPDLNVTRADPGQVEQILMNLCLNARDAMPQGGQLFIETDNTIVDQEFCRIHPAARSGPYVRLTVSDTGTGMDAKTTERIFEPFFTTKSPGKGTGLGLATAYGIVKQHDGFIHVYSEPGEGATFRIYFPVSAAAAAEEAAAPTQAAVRGGSETILVADDHEGLRDLLGESLQALGYHVLLAGDGEEALQQFTEHQSEIDLVVLDVIMPKLRGPEAYSRMSTLRPGVPVIFCTGYNADTPLVSASIKTATSVLQKPYTTKILAQQVRSALDGAHHA
jgi:two-component system cell cycle sensor histidine kinase/response regulator CckA